MFQMITARDEVVGATRATAANRAKSRNRRRSGLMLRVTMEPQKIAISMAPAREKSAPTGQGIPLETELARLAR